MKMRKEFIKWVDENNMANVNLSEKYLFNLFYRSIKYKKLKNTLNKDGKKQSGIKDSMIVIFDGR